jgi:hypothetical protein
VSLTARNVLGNALVALHGELGSWKAVGDKLGVSGGMAYRVAMQGYEPRAPSIRKSLGFPVTDLPQGTIVMGRAVTCRCGRVFVGKWGNRRKLCPVCRPPSRQGVVQCK